MNAKSNNAVLLVTLVAVLGGAMVLGVGLVIVYVVLPSAQSVEEIREGALPYEQGDDLAAARSGFDTKLQDPGVAPGFYNPKLFRDLELPEGLQRIKYNSGDLELNALISVDPGDEAKHPAVVFLHDEHSVKLPVWQETAPLREAGFVVMAPALRAENGNPGQFQLLYGELDDSLAAGKHLAALSYVDPEKVYVVGRGAGGLLAVLSALVPSDFKAAVAINTNVDFEAWLSANFAAPPYDPNDPQERRLRNPLAFPASLQCPLFLLNLNDPALTQPGADFIAQAKQQEKTAEQTVITGDETTSIETGMKQAAELLKTRFVKPGRLRSTTHQIKRWCECSPKWVHQH